MARKYKSGGSQSSASLDKNKKYKYNKAGTLVESTGTPGDNEIVISGSKSSLRRMADVERNVAIIATILTTDDGLADDGNNASFDKNNNDKTRFKKEVRMDTTLKMKATIDMNGDKIVEVGTATVGTDAANKAYVDTAIASLVDSAPGTMDTLNEIAAALGDDANYAATTTAAITAASNAAGAAQTTANTAVTNAATANTSITNNQAQWATDTNTTYSAGNGMTLSGTQFLMSGSYTGNFTATGDITAYSDDTLKTNVQLIDGALGRVQAIRGVTFDRISDGSTSTGVIAQELKAVLPEAVHTDANGVHSVAYGNITGLLIEAVKELSEQVNSLKSK